MQGLWQETGKPFRSFLANSGSQSGAGSPGDGYSLKPNFMFSQGLGLPPAWPLVRERMEGRLILTLFLDGRQCRSVVQEGGQVWAGEDISRFGHRGGVRGEGDNRDRKTRLQVVSAQRRQSKAADASLVGTRGGEQLFF